MVAFEVYETFEDLEDRDEDKLHKTVIDCELLTLGALHAVVGIMISIKLRANFNDYYQQLKWKLLVATILLVASNITS